MVGGELFLYNYILKHGNENSMKIDTHVVFS